MALLLLLFAAALPQSVPEAFTLGSARCGTCRAEIARALRTLPGRPSYAVSKGTLTLRVEGSVPSESVLQALRSAGVAVSPVRELTLSREGEAVGALARRVVHGAYTVFDFYADWCDPCELITEALGRVLERRKDVYVRRLNVKSFESPLAEEIGIEVLPRVEVFTPDGTHVVIEGADLSALERALGPRG